LVEDELAIRIAAREFLKSSQNLQK